MFVIFDLDGTLADCSHRQHLVQRKNAKQDWKAFLDACDEDTPIWETISTLGALQMAGHFIEIWSGRSDEVREKTEDWLRCCYLSEFSLRMRREGDYTPDDVLKKQWLDEVIAEGRRPDLVFDDRAKVVAMWRANGIPCFQVAAGDF